MLAQALLGGRTAAVTDSSTPTLLNSRVVCLLANDEAEEVKQTTIAFRRSIPEIRIEAVYDVDDAFTWAGKEPWSLILFAERLARDHEGDLPRLLPRLRAQAPRAAIIVLGEHDAPSQTLGLRRFGADYYCTPGFGHASMDLPMLALQLLEHRALQCQLDLTTAVVHDLSKLLGSVSACYAAARPASGDPDATQNRLLALGGIEKAVTDLLAQLPQSSQEEPRADRRPCEPYIVQSRQERGGDARTPDGR